MIGDVMNNNVFLISGVKESSNTIQNVRKGIDSDLVFRIKDAWKDNECTAYLREVEKVSDDLNFINLLLGELEYYINKNSIK